MVKVARKIIHKRLVTAPLKAEPSLNFGINDSPFTYRSANKASMRRAKS